MLLRPLLRLLLLTQPAKRNATHGLLNACPSQFGWRIEEEFANGQWDNDGTAQQNAGHNHRSKHGMGVNMATNEILQGGALLDITGVITTIQ